ncbi:E3 ubiquitin ligase TRAF3IP2-like isoform X1 [Clupea harengus]|uniref:E3 ubiquitin ligase TRAF3IP2 n=1 Tax=Clupea harengus TaxID=7950 RepID=A0A6P8EEG8_CLUHA|nr:E3 ubiquitin ligase TRAF3IP2-like isoform X1 [Clupea harengus]
METNLLLTGCALEYALALLGGFNPCCGSYSEYAVPQALLGGFNPCCGSYSEYAVPQALLGGFNPCCGSYSEYAVPQALLGGFNPCCGSYSEYAVPQALLGGFNPCCGSYSEYAVPQALLGGFNPCCGSYSEYAVPQPRYTSPRGTQLSMEQRKVFVTYESDSEDHVKEIIKFVALLRHNGFDTHIDVFEQQLNSISKIDCTERYIQEKDYLIIIAISPKYHEVVAGDRMFVERDERTLNTVYIHKQLQNEFIQNGCKNFRFIPILFPGAKKSHVPTWLQNTHVYSWPKDRDDILRRLMRVEKYNPPPIGELPTIVSIPI